MQLFYEDDRDAVRSMLASAGKTVKEAACHLWPRMKADSAYAKLYAQLNNHGDEELKFSEVVALMRWCERFDPLMYACDETHHTRPQRRSPDDHRSELMAVLREANQTAQKAMAMLSLMESTPSSMG